MVENPKASRKHNRMDSAQKADQFQIVKEVKKGKTT
jgi:hypothetical protein